MDKDFIDILKENSKNNMPDLWDKIESELEIKKKKNKKNILIAVASIAVIFSIAITGKNILMKDNNLKAENSINQEVLEGNEETSENSNSQNSEASISIDILPDLNLQEILEDKIILSLGDENSYTVDPNSIDYIEISDSIVYGKITDVKNYVKFGGMIYSDMTVEVINDYKGGFKEGDTFIMGSHGGEMTYEDYIAQLDPMRVEKFGYDKIEDKSKMFIDLWNGVPMYREGEYVLVYVSAIDNEEYYKEHPKLRMQESYDYGVYKRFYVNPNTREVFKYEYNMNNTLEKENVGTLDNIENIDLRSDLE